MIEISNSSLEIDKQISNVNDAIVRELRILEHSSRGEVSRAILAHLRNFLEYTIFKVYITSIGVDEKYNYRSVHKDLALGYVRGNHRYKFLGRFYDLLQVSTSHYTENEDNSERLMLKYYEMLVDIKDLYKNEYGVMVLENLETFPLTIDQTLVDYYTKIAEKIEAHNRIAYVEYPSDIYYIKRGKSFYVMGKKYSEITFTTVKDEQNKLTRKIAFTDKDVSRFYAVQLYISNHEIDIFGQNISIMIISDWQVSIRPCEIKSFRKIFHLEGSVTRRDREYSNLSNYLTQTGFNLLEVIDFSEEQYAVFKETVLNGVQQSKILETLDKMRAYCQVSAPGTNTLRYLLYSLKNKTIKDQIYKGRYNYETDTWRYTNHLLSNLRLEYGCIPFDKMPFAMSLMGHNPKLETLYKVIPDWNSRIHEMLARVVKENTEQVNKLYSSINTDLGKFGSIDDITALVNQYNSLLYDKHRPRGDMQILNGHVFITEYEQDTVEVITKLSEMSSSGASIKSNDISVPYSDYVQKWLTENPDNVDCEEKKDILQNLFASSKVAVVQGAAGVGKSRMIEHISDVFDRIDKIYLTKTHTALENVKRRVGTSRLKCKFSTVDSLNYEASSASVIIIDEGSTISNQEMRKVMNIIYSKDAVKLLVIIGDPYQIESISFGNWFSMLKSVLPEKSVFELVKPYRSTDAKLIDFWNMVRTKGILTRDSDEVDKITELIVKNEYATSMDDSSESFFTPNDSDEIVLCLNYDGVYGINNINRIMQSANGHEAVHWGIDIYKENDPVIFLGQERFKQYLYNNLKGIILKIDKNEEYIQFDVSVDTPISFVGEIAGLTNISSGDTNAVRFRVYREDVEIEARGGDIVEAAGDDIVVPFQIAYAASFHKAQGLEYNSVKIVITEEVDNLISHSIFYTAITRAKQKLKIYWSPEVQQSILSRLEPRNNTKDYTFLKLRIQPNE